jgi:polyketide cyclase/dehydrase/lipid transport protein
VAVQERSVEVAAPPEAVWRVWSDPARWPEWNPDVVEMKVDGPFATGSEATMRTRAGRTHRMQLLDVTPPDHFVLATKVAPGMRLRFVCTVKPLGPGRSRISQGVEMHGPMGALAARRTAPKIAASFEPILRGLAEKAEATKDS